MSWLTPLGFLGLLGIIALILIYILKPNYQQKVISTTFVWKLSLKYKKKKIPVSTLRNILLFICQLLAITAAALILAQPVIKNDELGNKEKIVIIDASANMLTEDDGGITRFEKAVEKVKALATEVTENDSYITVIIAGKKAEYLSGQRTDETGLDVLQAQLDDLIYGTEIKCTYGIGDIEGAMGLAETILVDNPRCEVMLYTGTEYIDKGKVNVIDVSDDTEWNIAILNAEQKMVENYYNFTVEVASYGRAAEVIVRCDINGYNGMPQNTSFFGNVYCEMDVPTKIVFDTEFYKENDIPLIYSFTSARIYVCDENKGDLLDTFEYDNDFYLYGGKTEVVDVQYYSRTDQYNFGNNFFSGALMVTSTIFSDIWDIDIKEVKYPMEGDEEEKLPKTIGYDFYIYEHQMPAVMPDDGIVFLVNPDKAPQLSDIAVKGDPEITSVDKPFVPTLGEEHPITKNIDPSVIQATMYRKIDIYEGYTPLMYIGEDPILLVKDTPDQKVVVLALSVHFSTLVMLPEFPMLVYNIFDYFLPATVSKNVFEVDEVASFKARGTGLTITGPGINETALEPTPTLPAKFTLTNHGTYTLTQKLINGELLVENIFVRIADQESNITRVEDELVNPYLDQVIEAEDQDLLLYFAIALVVFLFAEWLLHSKELF